MTPFVFDTLSASKQLREAGMAEGVAEAVVSVFQHASAMPDISHLATKADVADMATKADLADMATKADLSRLATKADLDALRAATKADFEALAAATKADLAGMATKSDVKAELEMLRHDMRAGFADVRAEVSEKLRQQALLLLGGVTALVTLLNVSLKVFG
ncbi:MAG: hypothetical protein Q8L23_08745 [Caulobacter sp.]|nr:hypothetical protein [Caulobacter sp.]